VDDQMPDVGGARERAERHRDPEHAEEQQRVRGTQRAANADSGSERDRDPEREHRQRRSRQHEHEHPRGRDCEERARAMPPPVRRCRRNAA
jgi:hypothetical protein